MKKKWLSLLVLACVANGASQMDVFASDGASMNNGYYDASTGVYKLDVHIDSSPWNPDAVLQGSLARAEGRFGLLGEQDVKDLPFSATVIGPKSMEEFTSPAMPLDKVLVNNPAIRNAGSNLHNDFTYRGLRANGTSSLVNGIPGLMTQFNAPTHMIDHIVMLNGPSSGITGSAVQYESNAAGGIVNMVTKKAGPKNHMTFTEVFTGKNNFGEYIDISKRFGEDKEWGIRINTEYLKGETAINGEHVDASSIYINLDRQTDTTSTNLIAGYRDIEIKNGMRWFKFGKDITTLPKVPDTSKNYSFNGMYKSSYGYVIGLNHHQQVSEHWYAFLNAGYNHNVLDNNIMPKFSAYTIDSMEGDFKLEYQIGGTPQDTYYTQLGTTGNYQLGEMNHRITVAIDKSWKNRSTAYDQVLVDPDSKNKFGTLGKGNIYTGIDDVDAPPNQFKFGKVSRATMAGISVLDKMSYKKWDAIIGWHHHVSKVSSYAPKTGALTKTLETSGGAPTYALVYKPNSNVTIYASHSEYFDTGTVVGPHMANAGAILDPQKSKQNEIGIKYMKDKFLTSLSFFDIEQKTNINIQRDINGEKKQFTEQQGIDRNKGVELTFNGHLTDKWSTFGGIMYLDARTERTGIPEKDGKRVSAQPYLSGVIGLEYAANEKFSMLGRLTYFGDSVILTAAEKELLVPSYSTIDFGMRYKTTWNHVPTTVNLMVYNLFNKEYWMASRGNQAYLSTPRSLMLSAQFNF